MVTFVDSLKVFSVMPPFTSPYFMSGISTSSSKVLKGKLHTVRKGIQLCNG